MGREEEEEERGEHQHEEKEKEEEEERGEHHHGERGGGGGGEDVPHNGGVCAGDLAVEHHGVQLHGASVEVLLRDRTELHRRAWVGGGGGEGGGVQIRWRPPGKA